MLRIGIMLDSYTTSAWVAKIVDDIQSSSFARVVLVVKNTPPPATKPNLRKRIENYWKLSLFNRYEAWDYRRNKIKIDAKAPVDLSSVLADVPCVTVDPIRKGFVDRFSDPDLATIQAANLDVLFRFGFRIIRGKILGAARHGVWSFHHDDNLEYRGGPPLFWEVFEGNPVSGTILQILTESLDGGHVIYRGHSATDTTSLYRNRNFNYWKTAHFAIRRLHDLDQHGPGFLTSLPTYNESNTYTRGIYRTPGTPRMLQFFARLFYRSLATKLSSRIRGSDIQWFLALRKRLPERSFADPSGYRIIIPPKDRFYADPFLIEHAGTTYLFFEDLRYSEHRALISCAVIGPDGEFGEPFEVLRRPYHLSYPFVFEHEGDMYMIPETKENRTVELYRATSFPNGWTLDTVLLNDLHAVDATVHQIGDKFWMLAGLSDGKYSNSDELGIFYADDLRGPWSAHPSNPVISDVRRARPAGALFYENGKLIRPSQNCGPRYGYGLVFSEILKLTETEYSESRVAYIDPGWTTNNLGTHTYSRTQKFEVIDGNFAAKIKT